MADVKEEEEGEGEEAALREWINIHPFGISVEAIWEFIVMQSNEKLHCRKQRKVYVSDQVEKSKSDRWLTQQRGGDEGWAATETGACDEACVIILTKGFMDAPAERQIKKSREERYRESGESTMFFQLSLERCVEGLAEWWVRL